MAGSEVLGRAEIIQKADGVYIMTPAGLDGPYDIGVHETTKVIVKEPNVKKYSTSDNI